MFLWKLLTASESLSDSTTQPANLSFWDKYGMMILVGAFLVLLVLGMFWSNRKRRKQQEEAAEKLNALGAGTKVETIGGIFGTIVEMNKKEGTFVLETGSDQFGKTYIRFDRNAIARIIDAVEVPVEESAENVEDEAPEFAPIADSAEVETEEKTEEKTEE
ncbi:MAG: preprotein translocase subunit YajC [Clostridia bacterium]|nr:preprotein translocase subunit YajC [Clostridia bacterium]MBQ8446310.1 preprotein translocase subunit YajC [Clostridia bacterium]